MIYKRQIAVMLVVAMLVGVAAFAGGTPKVSAAVAIGGPKWDQTVIDAAVKQSVSTMEVNVDFKWANTLLVSQVIYFLALVSYYNPNLTSTSGVKVSDRLIQHITYIISGGKEPSARGFTSGWIDAPFALALALAKETPDVWNELNKKDKEKCDFIMKYLAVSNNYCQNLENSVQMDLSQNYPTNKYWHPNMEEGNVHGMIAAYMYFGGADAVNKILADFNYDEYIAQMDAYNFPNPKVYFELTGKELLENGGRDAGGGSTKGARIPFVYQSQPYSKQDPNPAEKVPFEPYALFRSTTRRNFCHIVKSNIYGDTGYLSDGAVSPYEGRLGMCNEFEQEDAKGHRTDGHYVALSMRTSIPMLTTMKVLGYLKGDDVNDLQERMYVGVEDFFFKMDPAHGGWIGFEKGVNTRSMESNFNSEGIMYYKEVWRKYGKEDYVVDCKVSDRSKNATAEMTFLNFLKAEVPVKAIVASYDKDNKLIAVETKAIKIGEEGKTDKVTIGKQDGATVRVFMYDDAKGLQVVTEAKF